MAQPKRQDRDTPRTREDQAKQPDRDREAAREKEWEKLRDPKLRDEQEGQAGGAMGGGLGGTPGSSGD